MLAAVAQWAYALAAALFGAITMWQIRRDARDPGSRGLIAALAITTGGSLIAVLMPPLAENGALTSEPHELVQLFHLGWLGFLYLLWRRSSDNQRTLTVGALYGVVAALMLGLSLMPQLINFNEVSGDFAHPAMLLVAMLHILSIIGALVLVHNLYTAAPIEARDRLRLPLLGISALWIYDLNLYTIAYLTRSWPSDLFALRGVALLLTTPVFALAVFQNKSLAFRLSRTVTFQSLSLFAIGGYLVGMVTITSALDLIGGEVGRLAQIGFVFAASLVALLLGPSTKFRAWFRVKVSKHLFQHRYDYRSEWLRFTDTLGRPQTDGPTLASRGIKAIADIIESPEGILLTLDTNGALVATARWNWHLGEPPVISAQSGLREHLVSTGRVVELDVLREAAESGASSEEAALIPEWILAEPRAWLMVPLLHFERLAGVILLTRPALGRMLDWEDFDLLRVAGRQVASYLAESSNHEELADARRFEEFNRRFAFIMHDIKNLVSQLSLVTRNAERHADNPEFRADMIETLKSSTARMNALLARLSQHNKSKPEEPRLTRLAAIAQRVATLKSVQHPVLVTGDSALSAFADPLRFEQALSHLVQNAIEATDNGEPVTIHLRRVADDVFIEVIDLGLGMSPAFIDAQLFKPFMSTKEGGFGIGTFEARQDIVDMGGQLRVTSREGRGTTFAIILPTMQDQLEHEQEDRALVA